MCTWTAIRVPFKCRCFKSVVPLVLYKLFDLMFRHLFVCNSNFYTRNIKMEKKSHFHYCCCYYWWINTINCRRKLTKTENVWCIFSISCKTLKNLNFVPRIKCFSKANNMKYNCEIKSTNCGIKWKRNSYWMERTKWTSKEIIEIPCKSYLNILNPV